MFKTIKKIFLKASWLTIAQIIFFDTLIILLLFFLLELSARTLLYGTNPGSLGLSKLSVLLIANFILWKFLNAQETNSSVKPVKTKKFPRLWERFFWAIVAFVICFLGLWGVGLKKEFFFSFFSLALIFIVLKLLFNSTDQK